ncbi:rhomboid family intramembrane serine protease [Tautonia sociabilis]|uniref:Rhomboid family intramembrane serine protease n=1 Tax=Tautonia sociabilis TaxID=2080755 RepID=A0A432MQD8_9BACT|nr:rhomboid family intramembrane serine protease [Tautonia sociabilis]RUL89701.1 rhomboid family intramembrane serine protease [Tautonia sociabilis]
MPVEEPDGEVRPGILQAPATLSLAIAWVVVFLALAVVRGGPIPIPTALYGGYIPTSVSHAFGDVTPVAIYGGQLWRALTATFIHFNLLHLTLNLIAFVQLGRVVEEWYGSWTLLAIYLVLGVGGNLLANLIRPWMSGPPALLMHSGGGSTVVLGLIGLVTVVGWRNRSEFPRLAPIWMVVILGVNALLGVLVPNIDNLGHASGAAVGALVGLADRRLIRWARSRPSRLAGAIALVALLGSVAVQFDQSRRESLAAGRFAVRDAVVKALIQLDLSYHQLAARGPHPAFLIPPKPPNPLGRGPLVVPEDPRVAQLFKLAIRSALGQLDALPDEFNTPEMAEAYRTVRRLACRAYFKPPTPEELAEFEQQMPKLTGPSWARWTAASRELERFRRPEPRFASGLLKRLARPPAPPPGDASAARIGPSTPRRTPPASGSSPETP